MSPFETAFLVVMEEVRDALLVLCWSQGVERIRPGASITDQFEDIEVLLERKYTQHRQVDE